MNLQQRTDHLPPPQVTGPGGSGDGNLDALAEEGAAFLSAGHDIIKAALSGDSQAFLEASRQRGGE